MTTLTSFNPIRIRSLCHRIAYYNRLRKNVSTNIQAKGFLPAKIIKHFLKKSLKIT